MSSSDAPPSESCHEPLPDLDRSEAGPVHDPAQEVEGDADGDVSQGGPTELNPKPSRKRTKTGCLTCRRRRIKCGEERPICNNCIKSKRDCEGYSQRVVFKDPVPVQSAGSNLREDLVDPSKDPEHYLPGTGFPASDELGYETIRTTTQPRQALLPAIAPRPPSQYSFNGAGGMPTPPSPDVESFLRSRGSHPPTPTRSTHAHGFTQPLYPVANVFNRRINGGVSHAHATDDRLDHTVPSQGLIPQQGADSIHRAPPAPTRPIPGPSPTQFHTYSSPALTHDSANGHFVSPDIEQAFQPPASTPVGQVAVANRIVAGVNGSASAKSLQPFPGTAQGDVADATLDPYRTSLDEIMEIDTTPDHTTHEDPHRRDRGLMIALQANDDDHAMRSFRKHLDEPNLLATYRPSATSSGLMDLKTARIFRHFVTVTGPSLSIFERSPGNPYGLFSSPSLPGSRRSLWSYTLPTLALRHPPLLHAMLAVASLHIAKLQGDTVVPSLKHYHMALRRVARYVSLPSKRVELGTLAATQLLGFWEVMAAEHMKWNSHLLGARQLLVETDFAGLSRRVKVNALWRGAEKDMSCGENSAPPLSGPMQPHHAVEEDPIAQLTGGKARDAMQDDVAEHADNLPWSGSAGAPMMEMEREEYEARSDLFWWYLKQDLYQSILSGMGRHDAPYGTYDHLVLLLGRVADFAARDQGRKRKAMEGRFGPSPPASSQAPPAGAPSATAPPPMMYGMVPPRGPAKAPRGFEQEDQPSPASSASDQIELEMATAEAEAEWHELEHAMQLFRGSLGPHFQPLAADLMQPLSTPFGPAVYYKTSTIACLWITIYMGLIVLHRAHPSMPPAAMMAAGMAARTTAPFATHVGRITAGLLPTHASSQISPSLGGALIECTVPFFFAGVQLQDPAQRGWTTIKLQEIARLTGWETSLAIAAGCEIAWERTGLAGHGPPYTRTLDMPGPNTRDGRRTIDASHLPKENTDRRFVTVQRGTRVHLALGILGVEEDLEKLGIDEK
ncbi:MAG: hypothetical protein M1838_003280 [Thelocarpon superellum]|nr:MAG: hypothetical protein M1838_003280 [Thelocarpon superellum]